MKVDILTRPRLISHYVDAASKVKGERAAWKFIEDEQPQFSFNTILPHLVFGPICNPAPGAYSTATQLTQLFNGDSENPIASYLNPSPYIVDVRDVALIHIGALLDPETDRERLWAAAVPLRHINDILEIWRKAYPDRKDTIPKNYDFPDAPKQTIDDSKSVELLKRYAGRSWIDLKTTMIDNVRGLEK